MTEDDAGQGKRGIVRNSVEAVPITEAVAVFGSIERAVAIATQGEVEKAKLDAEVTSQQAKLDSEDFREQLKVDRERQRDESRIATIAVSVVLVLLLILAGGAVLLFVAGRSDDGRLILASVVSLLGGGGIGGAAGFAKGWSARTRQSRDFGERTAD